MSEGKSTNANLIAGDRLHLVLTNDQIDLLNPHGDSVLEGNPQPLFIEVSCQI